MLRTLKEKILNSDLKFVLNFETDGSMTPEIALREAAKELEMKFNQITTDLADSFSSR